MAGSSLLVLLDDIAAVLDDVATMTKVAVRKTAGVLGDDLAVNAEKVTGVRAERELPVVWAVAKGSLRNKCILVPASLATAYFAPWLIKPVLILGGLFLCYEGFEKVAHRLFHHDEEVAGQREMLAHLSEPGFDLVAYERERIKGAIRTDLILSLEIIVLTLGIVAESRFTIQVMVVSGIALMMTIGVYGLVAAIVKMDDVGFYLARKAGAGGWPAIQRWTGERLVAFAPWLMRALGIVGTIAMFMVGGGILVHAFHSLEVFLQQAAVGLGNVSTVGPFLSAITPTLGAMLIGVVAGAVVLGAVNLWQRVRSGHDEAH